MKTLVTAVIALTVALGPCLAADEDLGSLSNAGITVSYPPKMEAQAKRVLDVATKSIAPSVDVHRDLVALVSDADTYATEITSLLGCEELKEKTRVRLLAFKDKSDALIQVFSNIRLVETAEAVAEGGVDAGVLQVRYSRDKDDFPMALVLPIDSPDRLKRSFLPVFVNADGSIRNENKIADFAVAQLGTSKAMVVAPVHDAVNHLITQDLNLYHPFGRWFNEGAGGWVTRKVVTKYTPRFKGLVDEIFNVSPGSKKRAGDVNLPAWPQPPFQNRDSSRFDAALEAAQTQYAVELVSELFGGNRGGELAKVLIDIKYKGNPDTATICESIKTATGVDAAKKLAKYIPDKVRSADPRKLISQAEKSATQKKWADAVNALRLALEAIPDEVNARLNLAWLEREAKDRADSEIQVFIAASLLRQKEYSFHLFAPSLEGNYVLGRLAILVGNLDTARQFLEPVLQADPKHQDAKRAMQEIRRMERAVKQSAG